MGLIDSLRPETHEHAKLLFTTGASLVGAGVVLIAANVFYNRAVPRLYQVCQHIPGVRRVTLSALNQDQFEFLTVFAGCHLIPALLSSHLLLKIVLPIGLYTTGACLTPSLLQRLPWNELAEVALLFYPPRAFLVHLLSSSSIALITGGSILVFWSYLEPRKTPGDQ